MVLLFPILLLLLNVVVAGQCGTGSERASDLKLFNDGEQTRLDGVIGVRINRTRLHFFFSEFFFPEKIDQKLSFSLYLVLQVPL